jgi:lipid-binding SYLF domain-containing protein
MKNISMTAVLLALSACATAPKSAASKASLEDNSIATLNAMIRKDPGLENRLRDAAGYAVFPSIGKGGFIAGAAYGRGILYQNGRSVGFVELNQVSLGAQIGPQTIAEVIVFLDQAKVEQLKGGKFSLDANASAVVLTTGAAATAPFQNGVGVFVMPKGGAMAELSVSGQQINFQPQG